MKIGCVTSGEDMAHVDLIMNPANKRSVLCTQGIMERVSVSPGS